MGFDTRYMSEQALDEFSEFGAQSFLQITVAGVVFDVYLDSNGYYRDASDHRLVHRVVAEELIYPFGIFPLDFEAYDVHHIDKDKLNNKPSNLELLTRGQHHARHGVGQFSSERANDRDYMDFCDPSRE